MPQLVGLPCSVCHERISSEFESGFCPQCRNAVHDRCRAPAASRPGQCPGCGTNLAAARAADDWERRRQEQLARLPPPAPLDPHFAGAVRAWRLVRFAAGSIAAIAIGIVLLVEGEPAGLGALGAGSVIGALTVIAYRRGLR